MKTTARMITVLSALALPAHGATAPAAEMSAAPVRLPYTAVVIADATFIRQRPDPRAPDIGVVRAGAVVTVTGCVPDCASGNGWALLATNGALRASALRPLSESDLPTVQPAPEQLWYGRVDKDSRRIYRAPDIHARVLDRRPFPQEMAFVADEALRARGWLERVEGGYVRARQVEHLALAPFTGESQPVLPLVFLRRPANAAPKEGSPGVRRLRRYDRLALVRSEGAHVYTEAGTLPRHSVAVIAPRPRPAGIPSGAKWVHVNLWEQTLTAYEGDRPVYATLISSGKRDFQTHPGLYQVVEKMTYSDMHGDDVEPYVVDRVPYVLYFNKNEALHGTYWHDHFGAPASHGCVNLSMSDARWLFEWAPPRLPAEWSSIDGGAPGVESLWVRVDGPRVRSARPENEHRPRTGTKRLPPNH